MCSTNSWSEFVGCFFYMVLLSLACSLLTNAILLAWKSVANRPFDASDCDHAWAWVAASSIYGLHFCRKMRKGIPSVATVAFNAQCQWSCRSLKVRCIACDWFNPPWAGEDGCFGVHCRDMHTLAPTQREDGRCLQKTCSVQLQSVPPCNKWPQQQASIVAIIYEKIHSHGCKRCRLFWIRAEDWLADVNNDKHRRFVLLCLHVIVNSIFHMYLYLYCHLSCHYPRNATQDRKGFDALRGGFESKLYGFHSTLRLCQLHSSCAAQADYPCFPLFRLRKISVRLAPILRRQVIRHEVILTDGI